MNFVILVSFFSPNSYIHLSIILLSQFNGVECAIARVLHGITQFYGRAENGENFFFILFYFFSLKKTAIDAG